MTKKFILFVVCLTIAIGLLYPYDGMTTAGFFRLLGGVFFAAVAGILNWQDLEEHYEDRMS